MVAIQVLKMEQKCDLLAAAPKQALKQRCCNRATQARYCHRLRVREVEIRTAAYYDHHAERRSRCQRHLGVLVIGVVEQKLTDQAVGSFRLEDQR